METIGQRIVRLRNAKGWSRPELGRQMATEIGRGDRPFSGEAVRRYEEGIDKPGADARRALSLALGRSESYIEFGIVDEPTAQLPRAEWAAQIRATAAELLELADAIESGTASIPVKRRPRLMGGRLGRRAVTSARGKKTA